MTITAIKLTIVAVLLFVGPLTACRPAATQAALPARSAETRPKLMAGEPISPIPTRIILDPAKVALGERLFNDPLLSRDNTVSCSSCHNLNLGGADHVALSTGIDKQLGAVNTPTVFNAGYNFKQFWDGRADTVESQIDGPIHAPTEMGSNWADISARLRTSDEYLSEFTSAYADGVNTENIRDAIATFERSLITPNSRFDAFLRGDRDALTKEEKDGYRTFKTVGCISCHQGVNVGGNLFQEFGIMGAYFTDRGNITPADLGRYNVTHVDSDKYAFKVPSLRNVSKTAPYFHDGTAERLEDAIFVMSKYQLGRELSPQEIDAIIKFLRTLDGEYKRYNQ